MQKRLISFVMSVRPCVSACRYVLAWRATLIHTDTEWIFVKFNIGAFINVCRKTPDLVKVLQQYRKIYMKT